MKKIFSAALALVCVWFATPALANCNLLNPDTITSTTVTIPVEYGKTYVWSYDKTNYDFRWDSRAVYGVDSNNEPVDDGVALSPNGSASYNATSYFVIQIINPSVVAVQTIFRAASIQPTIESIKNSKMMFEEGTTVTPYQPYNPLCATCNGTIVNYTSATGTVSQAGTPTPTNPIEPTFYKQGNMVLRAVGNYKDSYDATTGKITRRVGVKVLDGTEGWNLYVNRYVSNTIDGTARDAGKIISSHFEGGTNGVRLGSGNGKLEIFQTAIPDLSTAGQLRNWLAEQYAAGTPVMLYYPLITETTEDWTETSYCFNPIKIATTKYNESAFGPLNTALQNAISVVDTVVSNTITQAASIATLQAQKQTRPNDIADDSEKCPAGKKCLLVEDASGVPHWYEIVEQYSRLPDGYTELEYIESTGTQYIDTGVVLSSDFKMELEWLQTSVNGTPQFFAGTRRSSSVSSGGFSILTDIGKIGFDFVDAEKRDLLSYTTNTWNTTKATVNGATIQFSLNDSSTSYTAGGNITTTDPLYIFDTNTNNAGTSYKGVYRLRKFIIKNSSGTLVRDMIPAKNPDGKIGMYDTVEGQFYENAGEGSFIAGDPVSE